MIFVGFLFNAFIVIRIFIWWLKGQTLQAVDIIMTSLGMVRILLLIAILTDIADIIAPHSIFRSINTLEYYVTATIFVAFCSLWWGTVLCVFYCVKITNFSNRLFLRLKMNISRLVPWLLLKSMMVSFLSSLPMKWCVYSVHYMNSTHDINSSNTGNVTIEVNIMNMFIIFFTGTFLPFLIFCATIGLLILSLLKHTRNMSPKYSGFTYIQLDAHIGAIRNLISFLVLYALYFITANLLVFSDTGDLLYPLLYSTCASAYPSLHSVILIASNVRLKRSVLDAFRCAGASHSNKQ
ncbi:taste receptor type 2 member 39-like [Mixophyes fleayi]|uniref:taste receptor type 2 member 39-like n=1 Tax=Mixophyes fleayi TaxID=3061075 RepID=UPI003F4DA0D9